MERDRILQPLTEREAAIEQLDTYASAGDLADAIVSVWQGLDRAVRLLLRADAGAPADIRMAAMSENTPMARVIGALRRRDGLSMEAAGRLHEAAQIAERVTGGMEPGPADADAVREAVRAFRASVGGEGETAPVPAVEDLQEPVEPVDPEERRSRAVPIVAVVLLLALTGLFVVRSGGGGRDAVEAFEAGRLDEARAAFDARIGRDSADVTALLYAARIARRQDRPEDAARTLQAAAARAPGDADVRRELGWLFLDLGRPEQAVEQFRLAHEAEPEGERNWIGLVRALRAAGDPGAEAVLEEAPASVRAAFGGAAR